MVKNKGLRAITSMRTSIFSCFNRVCCAVRVGQSPKAGACHADRHRNKILSILLMVLVAAVSGCASPAEKKTGPSEATIEEALRVFDDSAPAPAETPEAGDAAGVPGFAILLAAVPGRLAASPDLALEQVAGVFGNERDRVRLHRAEQNRPPLIVYGQYVDPGSSEAQADLARIRSMRVDGRTPFARAILMPIGVEVGVGTRAAGGDGGDGSRLSRNDLRNAKKLFGDDAVYTLQIGVYAREDNQRPTAEDLAAFRKAAEEAVARLRREGEQAFYYHGPNGSMVTVGIFNDSDLDTSVSPPLESARLKAERLKHPNNLLNGRGVREMIRGENGKMIPHMQESRLVLVPR